jgi:hypothetical protein
VKASDRVKLRTEVIVNALRELGPLSTAELADALGLPGPDTHYYGRKLRHIVGDMTERGITERAGTYAKYGNRNLEQFKLVDPGSRCTPVVDEDYVIPTYGPEPKPMGVVIPQLTVHTAPVPRSSLGLAIEGRKVGAAAPAGSTPVSRIVPKNATELVKDIVNQEDTPAAAAEPRKRVYPTVGKLGSDRLSPRDKLESLNMSNAAEKSLPLRLVIDMLDNLLTRVEGLEDVREALRGALGNVQDKAS